MNRISTPASRSRRAPLVSGAAVILFAACALALAAPAQRPSRPAPTLRFTHGGNAAEVPMELAANAVFVPVRLGPGRARSWLLDTASASTRVDAALYADSSARQTGAATPVLALPGLAVGETGLPARSFTPLGPWYGERVGGVVGDDVLSRLVVRLDYARRSIQLFAPAAFRTPSHVEKLAVRWIDGLPAVRAHLRLGGRTVQGDFVLNTAGGAGVVVTAGFLAANRMYPYRGQTIPSTVFSAAGVESVSLTRGEWLQLGHARIAGPLVAIEGPAGAPSGRRPGKRKANREIAGWIGGQILRKFDLVLDFPRNRVLLVPNRNFVFPIAADASGATVVAAGRALDRFEVRAVRAGSPAAKAGLEPGDRITWVDTDPATSLSLDELRALLSRPGHSPVLVVRRLGRRLKIQVHLRPAPI